jgi:hypothetical protein
MSRPSNLDLIARVRELEAALGAVKERAPIRVKALLKELRANGGDVPLELFGAYVQKRAKITGAD